MNVSIDEHTQGSATCVYRADRSLTKGRKSQMRVDPPIPSRIKKGDHAMRWWGPVHAHYAMTDMQSLTLSIGATLVVISAASLAIRAMKKRRLHATHIKTL